MPSSSSSVNISNASRAYKDNSLVSGANDRANIYTNNTSIWIGVREQRVLEAVLRLGKKRVTIAEVAREANMDRRDVFQTFKKFMNRGFVTKIVRGLYEFVVDVAQLLSVAKVRDPRSKPKWSERQADGTRIFNGGGSGVNGVSGNSGVGDNGVKVSSVSNSVSSSLGSSVELYFDNVRGYSAGGRYVDGDRDRTLSWWQVNSLYEKVTYAEVGRRVFGSDPYGDVLDGVVVIYTNISDVRRYNKPSIRVEYRPPRGYVKRNGLVSTVKLSFYEMLKAWKALTKAILSEASQNIDYLKMFANAFRSIAGMKILCSM